MTSAGMPRDIDRILDAWFEEGPTLAADRVVGAALAQAEQVGQVRPLGVREIFRRASGDESRQWMRTLAVVAATMLLLVVTIGLALQMGVIRIPGPTPVPVPTVVESASPAASSPSEVTTSETSLGPINWHKVESETPIYPWMTLDGAIIGRDYDSGTWWSTVDGLTWSAMEPTPWEGTEQYLEAGNQTLALVSPDSYGVQMGPVSFRQVWDYDWFESPDDAEVYQKAGEAWSPLALPPTTPGDIHGVRVSGARLAGAAALDESRWIIPAIHFLDVPWDQILEKRKQTDANAIWNEEKQVVEVFHEGSHTDSGPPIATLTVELAGKASPELLFRDADSGSVVTRVSASLPGWTPEAVMEGLRGWGLNYVSLIVRNGESTTVVTPPWGGEEWLDQAIVTLNGHYYTASLPYGPDYSAADIHLWESADGVSWTQVEVPRLWKSTLDYVNLAAGPDGLVLYVNEQEGDGYVWTSPDGREWEQAEIDATLVGYPEHKDFGWLMNAYDATSLSADGHIWEAVDLPDLPGEPTVTYLDGIFF